MEYGFAKGECLSHEFAYRLTGKKYPDWTARKEGKSKKSYSKTYSFFFFVGWKVGR